MKKKTLLSVLVLLLVYTQHASTQQYDPESDFRVTTAADGKSVEIISYVGKKQTVNIPPRINNLPITGIGEKVFYEMNITNVILPANLISIGNSAFTNCKGFTNINFPTGLESIGRNAFFGTNLSAVTIPPSVRFIGEGAFSSSNLVSVTFPSSVASIGDNLFMFCTYLTDVTIQSGVISIGDNAFSICEKLTAVNIPSSVTSIGYGAFWACRSITSITIPSGVAAMGENVFYGWSSSQAIIIEGHANQASADRAWGADWRKDCNARIIYQG